ncbi:carbohydrate binding family 6 [Colletotrichum plurivorum]|uniref:Carbohydrate binding family 6 n=1 Tax=Colletotrichum plurivorum TaxID=2175906 RepID=A0A8H6K1I2_9PEZI|nr:carbohydrate binding family 6 [Colletotrichum plurivorum]
MRVSNVAAAVLLALPSAQGQQAHVPNIPGFKLVWADDFQGKAGSPPDPANWIVDTGTSYPGGPPQWGTWEVQTYTNSSSNLQITGQGTLAITALRDANGGWTSGRIETKRSFVTEPGTRMRIQARLKLPNFGPRGIGYWAAFWTLGKEYRDNYMNWPWVGEIDIMENVNNVNRIWGVLHCDKSPGGACNEPSGIARTRDCPRFGPCPGNFRTYSIEIDRTRYPETIRWEVDGNLYHILNQAQLPAAVWRQTFQKEHFVLLNMAMGGAFPDAIFGSKTPIASTLPGGTFEAQYVAVYSTTR